MDETISVEVGEDHLAAFRRSPKVAIAELIWNGLDTDATELSVDYEPRREGAPVPIPPDPEIASGHA